MTWYAIRTAPGAQMPQRKYVVESTKIQRDREGKQINKGYRIVPSLDPNISAVERELNDAKVEHYMPVQRKVVRDRRKPFYYTTRRFALLVGYAFVRDVQDWPALEALPGVAGIVGCEGRPLSIQADDVELMRAAELAAQRRCEAELAALKEAAEAVTRRKVGEKFPAGAKVLITKGPAQDMKATVIGTARDGHLRALVDGSTPFGAISVPREHVRRLS